MSYLTTKEKTILGLSALGAVGFLLLLFAWPLVVIYALNILFPLLSIPYSFTTWLAVYILNITTFGGLSYQLRQIKEKL